MVFLRLALACAGIPLYRGLRLGESREAVRTWASEEDQQTSAGSAEPHRTPAELQLRRDLRTMLEKAASSRSAASSSEEARGSESNLLASAGASVPRAAPEDGEKSSALAGQERLADFIAQTVKRISESGSLPGAVQASPFAGLVPKTWKPLGGHSKMGEEASDTPHSISEESIKQLKDFFRQAKENWKVNAAEPSGRGTSHTSKPYVAAVESFAEHAGSLLNNASRLRNAMMDHARDGLLNAASNDIQDKLSHFARPEMLSKFMAAAKKHVNMSNLSSAIRAYRQLPIWKHQTRMVTRGGATTEMNLDIIVWTCWPEDFRVAGCYWEAHVNPWIPGAEFDIHLPVDSDVKALWLAEQIRHGQDGALTVRLPATPVSSFGGVIGLKGRHSASITSLVEKLSS